MKKKLINLGLIIAGNIIMAFVLSSMLLDNQIIVGGTGGIGAIAEHYLGVSVSVTVGITNAILFLIAFFGVGKAFAMRSAVSAVVFPIAIEVVERIPKLHGYMPDPLLASVVGGVLVGVGLGLIIKADASTGGIDIIPIAVHKHFPKVPVHIAYDIVAILILALQFMFNDTLHLIYGIVNTMVISMAMDRVLTYGVSMIQLTIVSDKYEEIKDVILHTDDSGVTMLKSIKGYSNEDTNMIMTITTSKKMVSVKRHVLEIDPMAFMIVSNVAEVGGQGFTIARNELKEGM